MKRIVQDLLKLAQQTVSTGRDNLEQAINSRAAVQRAFDEYVTYLEETDRKLQEAGGVLTDQEAQALVMQNVVPKLRALAIEANEWADAMENLDE